ncbi:MAG: M20/M25/M40 family metallo-hydrolase [Gemmatimonas sp.]
MPSFDRAPLHRQLAEIRTQLAASNAYIHSLDDNTLDQQIRLAGMPAPTGHEAERATWVSQAFRALGYASSLDDVGNVIASSGPTNAARPMSPVVCMAHLDTVFDDQTSLALTREGNRFLCPGIGDNSRGLAVMLTLAQVFQETPNGSERATRPIEFVATVGEEGLGNLRGARAYFVNRNNVGLPSPSAVLVLDGPGDQHIVHHALGSRRYRVTFRGSGGHSWVDYGAPNAIHAASRAAAWLADVPRIQHGHVALTVSGIGGGESMNAIPGHAWIEVDVRATDQELLMRVDSELRRIVNAALEAEISSQSGAGREQEQFSRAKSAFQSNIILLGERPASVLPQEHSLVRLAQAATQLYHIEPVSAVASTDANIPLSLGIPAIAIGGGGIGGGAHTVHEWYENFNAPRGVARAFAMLAALVG